jgi:hypothetical protein
LSRKLRLFVTAVAMLLGLFGSTVALAGTSSAATAPANSAQVTHTTSKATLATGGRTMVVDSATPGTAHPGAVFTCSGSFVSAFQFNFVCTVTSGLIEIIGNCANGTTIATGFFGSPPGTYSGFVSCGSGLVSVPVATLG